MNLSKYPAPRIRHHTNPTLYQPASVIPECDIHYPEVPNLLNWQDVFRDGKPPGVLDIGCGKGRFLLQHSKRYPNVNILGVEIRSPWVDWLRKVIVGEQIGNVSAMWYSVANGFPFIVSESLEYATYLFADPWPKKRHHKRRAFTPALVNELYRILKPGATLYMATDVDYVMANQLDVLRQDGRFKVSLAEESKWPFDFPTDHQEFCDRKGIEYVFCCAYKAQC